MNKRVAFLRDGAGGVRSPVIAGISDEEVLVPFEVYRIDFTIDEDVVERIFREFDGALAGRRLGLPLWKDGSEYRIPALLAKDWYDDRAVDGRGMRRIIRG